MSEKMKAYRINMITPEDVANGAKKGAIVYFYGTHPDEPGLFVFVEKPGDTDGIPLYMQQVARVEEFDRGDVETLTHTELVDVVDSILEEAKENDEPLNPGEVHQVVEARGAGLKYDTGKPRPSLLIRGMPRALMRVAEVLTFGAQKYEAHSWRSVENGEERYDDAKLRHMFKDAMGEVADNESTIEHLAHECCNLLFLLEKKLTEEGYTF